MGSILALLLALNIISGSSNAKSQEESKLFYLSSSDVRSGSERYTYTDDYVKDSSGRIIYQIDGSSIKDNAGRFVFSVKSKGLSGTDNYEVRNKRVYKNNKALFDLN